jgi:general secretion pathway protein K
MTAPLFRALQPHLTLFGPADPNPAAADPVVSAALVLSGALAASGAPPPPNPNASSDIVVARIHATAEGPGNARVRRMAVVRIGGREPPGYRPLAWGNDED